MKLHKFILISVLSLFVISPAFAQETKAKKTVEEKFWVAGVCGMCKNRIETALDVPGVKFATWDKETQILSVVYRQDKTSVKELKNYVTRAGHKTEHIPASKKAYSELPKCCQYDSGAKKH